jgi:hypothetical protein
LRSASPPDTGARNSAQPPCLSIYRFLRRRLFPASAANVLFDNICPLAYLPDAIKDND